MKVVLGRSGRGKPMQCGFTLIELLVVIAIIALLAAILFPVFARARENARKSSCANNLKQQGVGIAQYVQDFDEILPRQWYANNGNSVGFEASGAARTRWMDVILPYVKSTQVFTCPSHTSNQSYVPHPTRTSNNQLGSYAWNVAYWDGGTNPYPRKGPFDGMALADVQDVSETICTMDYAGNNGNAEIAWQNNGSTNSATFIQTNLTPPRLNGNVYARHLDTCNILFIDGHVKALSIDKMNERVPATGDMRLWTVGKD